METKFKENLKKLRVENKLNQKQLADNLNTTIKTVSHWETGYTEPSLSQILDIAIFFKVSLDDLLT